MSCNFIRHAVHAVVAIMILTSAVAAQNYPDRVIRIVVPHPAGGSVDVVTRIIAQKLSDNVGQQVIVENKAGANGNIGADSVAKAEPDGYTLLLAAPGPLAVNAKLHVHMPFDAATDFAPVALVVSVPIILMIHPDVPARSVKELIDLATKQPGKMQFGSSGVGSSNHLAGELFKKMAGIDIVHVPYRGAAPAMNDLIGGHIPILFDNMPASLPHITSGKVRAIAVAGKRRIPSLNLPTVSEAGLTGFEASSWFGLVAPAKTPAPVLARLTAEVEKVLKSPDVVARLGELGAQPGTEFGSGFGEFLKAERVKWGDVIVASGVKPQ